MKSNLSDHVLRLSALFLCIFTFVLNPRPTAAQEGFDAVVELDLIVRSEHSWSADSQQFVFLDPAELGELQPELDQPRWYQYNLATGILSTHNTWPLQPTLTPAEIDVFNPSGFIYSSPDNRYLLYGTRTSDTWYALADLTQMQSVVTNIPDYSTLNRPEIFNVQWSAERRVLVFSYPSFGGNTDLFYVAMPDPDTQFQVKPKKFEEVVINGHNYDTTDPIEDKFLDLSTDGTQILLIGRERIPGVNQWPPQLIIWTPMNVKSSEIVGHVDITTIRAASFAPSSNTEILILNEQSDLLAYDLETGDTRVLRTQLAPTEWFRGWFSPNGEWLAIESGDLYFLNIGKLLSTEAN